MQGCNPHGCCAGCGHGIATRIIYEVIEEMGLERTAIAFHDLACGSNMVFAQKGNAFSGAHGRAIPTATGYKRIRPDSLVFTYAGDGATYNIGMQHTVHTALRDENITAIVVNNTTFGMTGGQMSATSTIGQKTTSSPAGRDRKKNGNPVSIENLYGGMDIAYLARGSVDSVPNINKTKAMIKKAFEKQMAGEGFTYIEILAPCPTNWGLTPIEAQKRIQNELLAVYPVGEFIDR
ncbi:MAG: 2-oxoglutarate oxidoreductase [Clostridiales bacterium]|nr:2-oxoglutarate oxidoreductase [Clostridiales bacterium]